MPRRGTPGSPSRPREIGVKRTRRMLRRNVVLAQRAVQRNATDLISRASVRTNRPTARRMQQVAAASKRRRPSTIRATEKIRNLSSRLRHFAPRIVVNWHCGVYRQMFYKYCIIINICAQIIISRCAFCILRYEFLQFFKFKCPYNALSVVDIC